MRRFWWAPGWDRPGWVAAGIVLVVVIVGFGLQLYRGVSPPVVSAAELLHQAERDEARSLSAAHEPVVRQRVRIEINGKAMTRTIYRDAVNQRRAARNDGSPSQASDAEKIFRTTSFDWDNPLSPAVFDRWRGALHSYHTRS